MITNQSLHTGIVELCQSGKLASVGDTSTRLRRRTMAERPAVEHVPDEEFLAIKSGSGSYVMFPREAAHHHWALNPAVMAPQSSSLTESSEVVTQVKVTVGKSGRVTLPAAIRQALGLSEGTELLLLMVGGTLVLTPVVTVPRDYAWAYAPEHLERLNEALAEADEGRVRPLDEDELSQVLAS
jgi:antitoxin MazE